eukprot:symbB.v1.2.031411.t1/scaffold3643.1/size52769/3
MLPLILAVAAVKCLAECQTEENNLLSLNHRTRWGRHRPRRWRHRGGRGCNYGHYGTTVEDFLRTGDSSGPVACSYSKTYAYPSTVVQQDSGGVAQMVSRCSAAGETYVNNCNEATCLLNSNSDGYDYSKWTGTMACPYPAGATEYPTVTTQAQCKETFDQFVALGESVNITMNGKSYMTGIGHGLLIGVRGNCATISYEGRNAVIFQVDIRSWSLEITLTTLMYLTGGVEPGGNCFIPDVQIINCSDIPGIPV